jgi:ferric-dicitrate binding protein FerR (iron transport regulator)
VATHLSWQDLVDCLAGEAPEKLQQRVQQWRLADPRHEALWQALQQLWEAAAVAAPSDPKMLEQRWQELLCKMQQRGLPLPGAEPSAIKKPCKGCGA